MYVQCTMDMSTWSKWVGSSKHIFLKYLTIIYLKFPDILKFFDILKFSLVPPSSHIEIWLYGYKHLQVSLLPARYHPKLNFLEGDLVASIRARRLIIKLAKSVSKWAASDIMAKLPANTPPANIFVLYMNKEKNNCWDIIDFEVNKSNFMFICKFWCQDQHFHLYKVHCKCNTQVGK